MNEWWKEAKFQDATTLTSRNTGLKEFSAHRNLPQITTLDLSCNSLPSIGLTGNKNLNFLNLDCNQLTSITLDHLANLTVISLFNNKISKINLVSNQHLAWIDLQCNSLE
jgi:Leucine-rich repeat (LRR) protein